MKISFSVIIPLYNKEKQIRNTLDSVLNQTYESFEIVVVNDGSTDSSTSIIESYNDPRVRLYNKVNGGVSSARNFGVEKAKNEWIVPLDADDIMFPNALSVYSKMIEQFPNEKYFSGKTKWGNHNKGIFDYSAPKRTKFPHFMIWLRKIDPAPRNVVYHKSLVEKYGGYDVRMSFYEDWEFSIRLAHCGTMVYTDTYLSEYIQDGQGLSALEHSVEKEMAYYIPELLNRYPHRFWYKALLLENLEMQNGNGRYNKTKSELFSFPYYILHSLRQRLLNHHYL